MSRRILTAGFIALMFSLHTAWGHHSFAVYDFTTQIEFVGTVDTLNFKNPHISMTLNVTDADGEKQTVNFIEGAPANMLARKGLRPAMISPGTEITVFGSPLIADPSKLFIRRIRLADGSEFE